MLRCLVIWITLLVVGCTPLRAAPRALTAQRTFYFIGQPACLASGKLIVKAYGPGHAKWILLIGDDGSYTLQVDLNYGVRGHLARTRIATLKRIITSKSVLTLDDSQLCQHQATEYRILKVQLGGRTKTLEAGYTKVTSCEIERFDQTWRYITSLVMPPTESEMKRFLAWKHSHEAHQEAQQERRMAANVEAQLHTLTLLQLPPKQTLPAIAPDEDVLSSLLPRNSEMVMGISRPFSKPCEIQELFDFSDFSGNIKVKCAVLGARELSELYHGARIVAFESYPGVSRNYNPTKAVNIAGYTIYYSEIGTKLDRSLEFLTFPYPNIMVEAWDVESLQEVLRRMSNGRTTDGFPGNLHDLRSKIDNSALYWGARDIHRDHHDEEWHDKEHQLASTPTFIVAGWTPGSQPIFRFYNCTSHTLTDARKYNYLNLLFSQVDATTLEATTSSIVPEEVSYAMQILLGFKLE